MSRACCVCRRQITGEGANCVAIGHVLPPHKYNDASHGFCVPCFEDLYGPLDGPRLAKKKEESAGV